MPSIGFAPLFAMRARRAPRIAALLALVLAFAIPLQARAQGDDALPARVGRVASIAGTLRHAPEGRDAWSEIGLNYPVAQGERLWTAADARAEIDYGGGEFRLGGDTNVHVSRLDESELALFVATGRVIVRVRYLEAGDAVRVDTAATQVALARPGLYRIDVDPDAQRTKLTVREGEADMGSVSGVAHVLPGQSATIAPHDALADVRNGAASDGFDAWSAERDRVYESPRANEYVPREMVGASDFDGYGDWQTYPEYGAVWFPTVDPEWAPYRFGYWTWLPGFGYTWVDEAPWGYAPFHYGRWVHVGGRWGWCPGRFAGRPAWAPALVAWYGDTTGRGHVYGWVPLGWGEPYVPPWRCTDRCSARYNRPYAVPAARPDPRPPRYANAAVPNAITQVPAATLTAGRPVAGNRVPVPVAPPLAATPPAITPERPRPAPPRSPAVAVPPSGATQPSAPAAATVRPIPVPPPAPTPPVRAPQPSLPLPRVAPAPIPPAMPPPAVVPMPARPMPPAPTPAPVPVPAPAVTPAPNAPVPAPVAPPRPPASPS